MGKIPADYLPPSELRPQRIYTLPEFKNIPQRLNSTEELLDKTVAAGKGDRVALCFDDKRIPYKALLAQVNKLGSALKKLGIEEGDRVALRLPNIPPAICAEEARDRGGRSGRVAPTEYPAGDRGELRRAEDRRRSPADLRSLFPVRDRPRVQQC